MLGRRFRRPRWLSQRAQTATEFALISPVIFLVIMLIVDFGRVIYIQATINQAVNEGARVAVRGEPPDYAMPSDVDVESMVKSKATDVSLANPCPNGPINNLNSIPKNSGWLFITEAPAPTVVEASPSPNAPGLGAAGPGQTAPAFTGSCNSVVPASGNAALQVTIYYNFAPITPMVSRIMGDHILISAYATYRTEY